MAREEVHFKIPTSGNRRQDNLRMQALVNQGEQVRRIARAMAIIGAAKVGGPMSLAMRWGSRAAL